MSFYVYLLLSSDNCTYVGATVNLDHRLRQHNKELKGGAKATSIKVDKGELWLRVVYVTGFPDWKSALQFEWKWKHLTRKLNKKIKPLNRRMMALNEILLLKQTTSKALPYDDWLEKPKVIFEDKETENIFNQIK